MHFIVTLVPGQDFELSSEELTRAEAKEWRCGVWRL